MAEIVGALGVPHTPFFPSLVEREGPECETARFFAAVTKELEAMRPDLIVMYDTDHLNTFFLDNLPVFAIGVTGDVQGAERRAALGSDLHHQVAPATSPAHLRRICIEAGFDLALTQEFTVDHSVVVPLHFMTPAMRVPVIPIFVERARSAAAFGAALLRARRRGQARDRELARASCAWSSSAAEASRSRCSARASRRASRMACPIPTGPGGSAR